MSEPKSLPFLRGWHRLQDPAVQIRQIVPHDLHTAQVEVVRLRMAEVGAGHLAPRFGLEEGGGDGVGGEEGGEEEASGTSADDYDWVIGGGAGRC